jgi:hypothetical protein
LFSAAGRFAAEGRAPAPQAPSWGVSPKNGDVPPFLLFFLHFLCFFLFYGQGGHGRGRFVDTYLRFVDTYLRFVNTYQRFVDTYQRFVDTHLQVGDGCGVRFAGDGGAKLHHISILEGVFYG